MDRELIFSNEHYRFFKSPTVDNKGYYYYIDNLGDITPNWNIYPKLENAIHANDGKMSTAKVYVSVVVNNENLDLAMMSDLTKTIQSANEFAKRVFGYLISLGFVVES